MKLASIAESMTVRASDGPGVDPLRLKSHWVFVGLSVWLVLVIGSMAFLWKYKNTPGPMGDAPVQFPASSRMVQEPGLPVLILFAHPMCPCTRASLSELRVLMSEFQGRVTTYVAFLSPGSAEGKTWSTSDVWPLAKSIPGVHVLEDTDGSEARAFGAMTSGHVVLYNKRGQLLFSGGITSARGHVGNNPGRTEITRLLRGDAATGANAPVFGCPLDDPT